MFDAIKNRILYDPDELDSALRYSDMEKYREVMTSLGVLTAYGREINSPDRDKRIDQQVLDEVEDLSQKIDAILDDFLNADPGEF